LQACLGIDISLCRRMLDHRPYRARADILSRLEDTELEGVSVALLEHVVVKPSDVAVSGDSLQCWENTKLHIDGSAENVKRAWFGSPGHRWEDAKGAGWLCTEQVIRRLTEGGGAVTAACECLGSDPVPGVRKQLCIELFAAVPVETMAGFPSCFSTSGEVPSNPRWVAFIRHAQAEHNVDDELAKKVDTELTDAGIVQALKAKDGPAGDAVRLADLVVTSPLTRAMQTTGLLLGPASTTRVGIDAQAAERPSGHACDVGSPKSKRLGTMVQGLPSDFRDWEGWESLPEDNWWPTVDQDQWARREAFVQRVRERPEDRIVFIGHGAFWCQVTGKYLNNCEAIFCDRSLV